MKITLDDLERCSKAMCDVTDGIKVGDKANQDPAGIAAILTAALYQMTHAVCERQEATNERLDTLIELQRPSIEIRECSECPDEGFVVVPAAESDDLASVLAKHLSKSERKCPGCAMCLDDLDNTGLKILCDGTTPLG